VRAERKRRQGAATASHRNAQSGFLVGISRSAKARMLVTTPAAPHANHSQAMPSDPQQMHFNHGDASSTCDAALTKLIEGCWAYMKGRRRKRCPQCNERLEGTPI